MLLDYRFGSLGGVGMTTVAYAAVTQKRAFAAIMVRSSIIPGLREVSRRHTMRVPQQQAYKSVIAALCPKNICGSNSASSGFNLYSPDLCVRGMRKGKTFLKWRVNMEGCQSG